MKKSVKFTPKTYYKSIRVSNSFLTVDLPACSKDEEQKHDSEGFNRSKRTINQDISDYGQYVTLCSVTGAIPIAFRYWLARSKKEQA